MRFYMFLTAMLAVSFALSACKDEQRAETAAMQAQTEISGHENNHSKPAFFQCGETLVEFQVNANGKGNMRIANTSYAMEQTISASGARYQNLGDEQTVFWNKGNKAWVTIDGNDLPECDETTKPVIEKPYRAQGNEPGWIVTVENKTIMLDADYGETKIESAIHSDEIKDGVRIIHGTHDVTVTIDKLTRCQDDMSGESFAHTVNVHYGDKTYQGCGQSMIRHVTWQLEDMNKGGIIDRSHLTMTMGDDGRIYGNSGCNLYSSQYTLEGDNLSVNKNIIMTMRACIADSLMQQEQKFLSVLPEMTKAAIDETGALVLTGNGDQSLLFRQSEDE